MFICVQMLVGFRVRTATKLQVWSNRRAFVPMTAIGSKQPLASVLLQEICSCCQRCHSREQDALSSSGGT